MQHSSISPISPISSISSTTTTTTTNKHRHFDEELIRRKYENQRMKTYSQNVPIPIRKREDKEILSASPQISDALQIMSQVSISPSLLSILYDNSQE
jgi:hypothetical protein